MSPTDVEQLVTIARSLLSTNVLKDDIADRLQKFLAIDSIKGQEAQDILDQIAREI